MDININYFILYTMLYMILYIIIQSYIYIYNTMFILEEETQIKDIRINLNFKIESILNPMEVY